MNIFELIDGRLYQWDTDRKIKVLPQEGKKINEVHFAHEFEADALPVEVDAEGAAKIPDILLQSDEALCVWAVAHTDDGRQTLHNAVFTIRGRAKPEDYVYTEPEIKSYEKLEKRIKALEENGGGGGAVESVNGQTGAVELDAEDVGALSKKGGTLDGILKMPSGSGIAGDTLAFYNDQGGTTIRMMRSSSGQVVFLQDDRSTGFSEFYRLPLLETGLTTHKRYDILTTKDAASARNSLDVYNTTEVDDKVSKIADDVERLSEEIAQNDIPIMFYGAGLPQTKDDAVMSFDFVSKSGVMKLYCETKAQGNSSMSYPKKNQTTKFYADAACAEKAKVNFRNWGAQNKFCMKANWIDISHARNVVSARIWGDIVRSRANFAELPELLRTSPNVGAIDGFPVVAYADGVYLGRYTLNIPKDPWMANMDDANPNHCILCGEDYGSGCFRATALINGSDWSDEIHDVCPDNIKTRWNEVIAFVMNSTDEEFRANLGNYFYVDSLIDYLLYALASCGLDSMGKNQIYMTYDGQKWIASMYDMDSTWGLYHSGQQIVATDYARTSYEDYVNDREGNLLYIRLEQNFPKEIKARWEELKNGALSYANIMAHFEQFFSVVPPHVVEEDYATTTGNGLFTGIPSKTTNNIQQIRDYARARQIWTDNYVTTVINAVPCEGITLDKTALTFNSNGTQAITATVLPADCTEAVIWESDNTDVAIVDNGNVIALANGTANITARCGDYSATCAVTVSGIVETVLYKLAEAKTFDGASDYINTGVQLAKYDISFTIILHAQGSASNSGEATLFHAMQEEPPYNGYSLAGHVNKYRFAIYAVPGNYTDIPIEYAGEFKAVITREAGSNTFAVKYLYDGNILTVTNGGTYTWSSVEKNLLLGCYQTADGTNGRFWTGTLYDFAVYNEVWSEDKINAYLT